MKRLKGRWLGLVVMCLCCLCGFSAALTTLYGVSANGTATPTEAFEMVRGASVRIANESGLRFRAKIGEKEYGEIVSPQAGTSAKLGMIIVPYEYLGNASAYSDSTIGNYQNLIQKIDLVFYDSSDSSVKNNVVRGNPDKYAGTDENYYYINGAVVDIKFDNYKLNFIGIAYIATTDGNGETSYTFTPVTESDNARNVIYCAVRTFKESLPNADKSVLNNYISGGILKELGFTYDETTQKYKLGTVEYATIEAAVTGEGLSELPIELDKESYALSVYDEGLLTASCTEIANLNDYMIWTSSNENAVKVDGGNIFCADGGEATVSAKYLNNVASCQVTVSDERARITLDKTVYKLDANNDYETTVTSGNIREVFLNGEDVTQSVVIAGNKATIPYSLLSENRGENVFQYRTADAVYSQTVAVATHIIANKADFDEWYADYRDNSTDADVTATYYAVLTADIDYGGGYLSGSGNYNSTECYAGGLDGQGHTITGLGIYRALFGGLKSTAVIKDIAFKDTVFSTTSTNRVALIAYGQAAGARISNVYLSGTIEEGGASEFGGLVDYMWSDIYVTNCIVNMTFKQTVNPAAVITANRAANTTYMHDNYGVGAFTTTYDGSNAGIFADNVGFFANVTALPASDGWSEYWSITDGVLTFGGVELLDEKERVDGGELLIGKGHNSVDLSDVISEDFVSVTFNSEPLTPSGKTVTVSTEYLDELSTREIYKLIVKTETKRYMFDTIYVSHFISTKADFDAWYQDYFDNRTNEAVTAKYYAALTADIDYGNTYLTNSGSVYGGNIYAGVLDGRGHTITGLGLLRNLIGKTGATAVIKDIAFKDIRFNESSGNSTALIGYANVAGARITNVYISGTIASGGANDFDGIATNMWADVIVTNCIVNMTFNKTMNTAAVISDTRAANATFMHDNYGIGAFTTTYQDSNAGIYADATSFFTGVTALSASDGWSDYWSIDGDGLKFNGVLLISKV